MIAIPPEELAAVIAALNALQEPQTAPQTAIPAWRRAMRTESVLAFDE